MSPDERVRAIAHWDQTEAEAVDALFSMADRIEKTLASIGERDPAIVSAALSQRIERSPMSHRVMANLLAAVIMRLRGRER